MARPWRRETADPRDRHEIEDYGARLEVKRTKRSGLGARTALDSEKNRRVEAKR